MKHHLNYVRYVLRHKYYVFIGCMKLNISFWQALIHDWTKFQPIEWRGYVQRMRDNKNSTWQSVDDTPEYKAAWEHHWHNNPHHWEYWVTDGVAAAMPEKYVREMVADWHGAGSAQGKPDIAGFYAATKHRRTLHPATTKRIEELLPLLKED